jgi:hypothetical protein
MKHVGAERPENWACINLHAGDMQKPSASTKHVSLPDKLDKAQRNDQYPSAVGTDGFNKVV